MKSNCLIERNFLWEHKVKDIARESEIQITQSQSQKEIIKADPVKFLNEAIKKYVTTSPNNIMPNYPGEHIWDEPLIGFADGDDPIFQEYKTIIGDFHVTPREALEMHLGKTACGYYHPDKISVISWILPSTEETRRSLREETSVCSLRWNYTRWHGQEMNFRLSRYLVVMLEDQGYHAVAPELGSWWEVKLEGVANPPASRWSQRHIAYAAGLGTFSLNDGFITERGIAVRAGSIVCDLEINSTKRIYQHHLANCLSFREGTCGVCISRCPAGAITEKGHDKKKCGDYQFNIMPKILKELGRDHGYIGHYLGCGLCQTKVPCEGRIPKGIQ
jgi:ferredoxin